MIIFNNIFPLIRKEKDKRILFYKFNDQDYELDQNKMIKVFPVDSGSEYLQ